VKPRVFVASSSEALEVAYALQHNLSRCAEVTVWDQGVVLPSSYILESIVAELKHTDFGVFVFAPTDVSSNRGEEWQTVRDNVVYELGLFAGRLGRERCFVVLPEDIRNLRLPSDLLGLETVRYESARSNLRASLGPATSQICSVVQRLKRFIPDAGPGRELLDGITSPYLSTDGIDGLWLSRFDFRAYRNGEYIAAAQFNLELVECKATGRFRGKNLSSTTLVDVHYQHEFEFRIARNWALGLWINRNTENIGCFQLLIHTSKRSMTGYFLGNANDNSVQSGGWLWLKVTNRESPLELRGVPDFRLKPFEEVETIFTTAKHRGKYITFEEVVSACSR
jgi:hypothetical protein